MNWLRSMFAPVVRPFHPIGVRDGDDLVLYVKDRLDSDQAFALLDALSAQFPQVRIHLLTGFAYVQRPDSSGSGDSGKDGANPPLPVLGPSASKPNARLPDPRTDRGITVLTYVTSFCLIAVYVPPKQESDPVSDPHVIPRVIADEHGSRRSLRKRPA